MNEFVKISEQSYRSLMFAFGKDAKLVIPRIVHLTRRVSKSKLPPPKILWITKGDEFKYARKCGKTWSKKIKNLSKSDRISDVQLLEIFLASSTITFCSPYNTKTILGQTHNACIFQGLELLTPNIIARCVETVGRGGVILFVLEEHQSFHQLCHLHLEVHDKFRTHWFPDVKPKFMTRFIQSLTRCYSSFAVDDKFNITHLFNNDQYSSKIPPANGDSTLDVHSCTISYISNELANHGELLNISKLIGCCATVDQVTVVLKFFELLKVSANESASLLSLVSGRGRGKSASIGLGLVVAILNGSEDKDYIFIRSCSSDNSCNSKYKSNNANDSCGELSRNATTIEADKFDLLTSCDLLCIDESAAIPLNWVRSLIQVKLCVMASTIQGYEGTGRSLSLKLLSELRRSSRMCPTNDVILPMNSGKKLKKRSHELIESLLSSSKTSSSAAAAAAAAGVSTSAASLHEITLNHCIRYCNEDPVENWMNDLFCLSVQEPPHIADFPNLDSCQLFRINLSSLFAGSSAVSNKVLDDIVAIYVASHYKNSPNDLLMLADAPAHRLFCLLGPNTSIIINNNNDNDDGDDEKNKNTNKNDVDQYDGLQIICVMQVAYEGNLSVETLRMQSNDNGDLIPWLMNQQFPSRRLAEKKGIRIVRIATHTSYQKMGYGKRAMQLLENFYSRVTQSGKGCAFVTDDGANKAVIFESVDDIEVDECLDYIGTSFGASLNLIRFWKSLHMHPVYISQVPNLTTGEHSCIFMKEINNNNINNNESNKKKSFVFKMWLDFRLRFLRLLPYDFKHMNTLSALELLTCTQTKGLQRKHVQKQLIGSGEDRERLLLYMEDRVELRAVKDVMHSIACDFFSNYYRISSKNYDNGDDSPASSLLSSLKKEKLMTLVGCSLQGKDIKTMARELNEYEKLKISVNKSKKHIRNKDTMNLKQKNYEYHVVLGTLNQAFKIISKIYMESHNNDDDDKKKKKNDEEDDEAKKKKRKLK
ncbi:hypothetical protein HELRODRAFT_167054 [Helobdella robusta]|uniref:N-acetyltransferase domain-containing protein n=1 Tax=Helobdella robusta TaxID=6412 RepID=T1EYY4_HELRO|nr:hypothetical protein HELRODRAFT_167054 [Helobdella robusta]ESO10552.1 hypothetical protein HELRODRAFT_167054 [Helobdella robusta]